jgi:hypothetical protein
MSLKIPAERISWLRGYSEKTPGAVKDWDVYEYDYGGVVEITLVGDGVTDKEKELTDWFYHWYNPAGYGSSVRKTNKDGKTGLLFHRFKSCD